MRAGRAISAVLAAGAALGAIVLLRRHSATAAVRADLYFEDGSMLSLDHQAPEIDGLMRAARLLVGEN
ncbi:MAG: hypothetical protein EXQ67_06975 [Thermoleophilia bacterium]|nr:hypothetical protein [Thermoleophilia bacterium]